mgnify:CR=1 FL=1
MTTIEYEELPPGVVITYTRDGITVRVVNKANTEKEGNNAPPSR